MTTAVAVFTGDLRLHDNPALHAAVSTSSQVIPCFIVDDKALARYAAHGTRLASWPTRWPIWTPACAGSAER
jgi:deoxyribodipyrimidine photo-lyase